MPAKGSVLIPNLYQGPSRIARSASQVWRLRLCMRCFDKPGERTVPFFSLAFTRCVTGMRFALTHLPAAPTTDTPTSWPHVRFFPKRITRKSGLWFLPLNLYYGGIRNWERRKEIDVGRGKPLTVSCEKTPLPKRWEELLVCVESRWEQTQSSSQSWGSRSRALPWTQLTI